MNKADLTKYISELYSVDAEFPWTQYPDYMVFRHSNNKKWFAVIMNVPKEKLGLSGTEMLDILNVKCDPIAVGSFRLEPGIYPAYHMNKNSWISVALDGSADDQKIKMLLDMSFELTATKQKAKKCSNKNAR